VPNTPLKQSDAATMLNVSERSVRDYFGAPEDRDAIIEIGRAFPL
jgi:hypothetical protein